MDDDLPTPKYEVVATYDDHSIIFEGLGLRTVLGFVQDTLEEAAKEHKYVNVEVTTK